MKPLIFKVALPVPLYRLFDYLAPEGVDGALIKPGVRLEVPFGKGTKTAVLIEVTEHSELDTDKLKHVLSVLDDKPLLSAKDLQLLHWASHYYHHPLGEVISTAIPNALRQGNAMTIKTEKHYALT